MARRKGRRKMRTQRKILASWNPLGTHLESVAARAGAQRPREPNAGCTRLVGFLFALVLFLSIAPPTCKKLRVDELGIRIAELLRLPNDSCRRSKRRRNHRRQMVDPVEFVSLGGSHLFDPVEFVSVGVFPIRQPPGAGATRYRTGRLHNAGIRRTFARRLDVSTTTDCKADAPCQQDRSEVIICARCA